MRLRIFSLIIFAIITLSTLNGMNELYVRDCDDNEKVWLDKSQNDSYPDSETPMSATQQVKIYPTTFPSQNCRNISETLSGYQDFLLSSEFISDRTPDIMSTLWAVLSLKIIDSAALSLKKPGIIAFLLSRFNNTTCRFEEAVNYPTTGWLGVTIAQNPYQTHLIHQAALIILGELGVLSTYFSPNVITNWKDELWGMKQPDKGFGNHFAQNSTLTETYFAVYALLAINGFSGLTFSAAAKQEVSDYLLSRMNPVDHWFIPNAIREFHTDPVFGFEFYTVTWYFAQVVAMLGLNTSLFSTPIRNYLIDNAQYNEEKHCFLSEWNDKNEPQYTYYSGSAIWGEIIRIMGIEGHFPDLPSMITTLKNGLRWTVSGVASGPNYFQSTTRLGDYKVISPFMQYLTLLYLSNKGELLSLEIQNPTHYGAFKNTINRFFTLSGGASFHHPDIFSPQILMAQYGAAAFSDSVLNIPAESVLYTQIMQNYGNRTAIPMAGFVDRALSTDIKPLLIRPLYSVEQTRFLHNYYGLKFLYEFDLLDNYYLDVGGSRYLEAEGAVVPFLKAGGYFASNTNQKYVSHLQNTFYALGGQKILIDFDTGQSFATYYSQAQIQSMLDFVQQFIVETDTLWYALTDSPVIDQIEATYYCYSIINIFNETSTIIPKVIAYVQSLLATSHVYTSKVITAMAALAADLGVYFPFSPEIHSHSNVENAILLQQSQNSLNSTFGLAIQALGKTDSIVAFIQYQPLHTAGHSYTVKMTAGTWINMQSITDIQFHGLEMGLNESGYAWIDYYCPFNPLQPNQFSPIIQFRHNAQVYATQLEIDVLFSYQIQSHYRISSTKCVVDINITANQAVYEHMIQVIVGVYYEDILFHTPDPNQIVYTTHAEGMNITVQIPVSVFTKYSITLTDYLVLFDFPYDFMSDLWVPITFEIPPEPVNDPPEEVHNIESEPKTEKISEVRFNTPYHYGIYVFSVVITVSIFGFTIFAYRKSKSIKVSE